MRLGPLAVPVDTRCRLWENWARKSTIAAACDVFDTNKTQAVLQACRLAARLNGENDVEPGAGAFARLLEAAEEHGSLTGEEIAAILSTDELPIEFETMTRWQVGAGD